MHLVASPEEFRERVRLAKADNILVVVDYFAPWCHACKSLHPQLQKLAAKYNGVMFLSVSHPACVSRLRQAGHVQHLEHFNTSGIMICR